MKFVEITGNEVKNNIKKNKKIMVIILFVCILLGCSVGALDAQSYLPVERNDTAQQPKLDLNSIENNESYYYNAFMVLEEKNAYLNAYIKCLQRVNLSKESQRILETLSSEVCTYQETYDNAEAFYYVEAPFIYGKKKETVTFYESEIAKFKKYRAEQEAKLDGPNGNNSIVNNIARAQLRIDTLDAHIKLAYERDKQQAEKIDSEADIILENNYQKINGVIDAFNNAMVEIEKADDYEITYYERVFNDYYVDTKLLALGDLEKKTILNDKKNQAIIYAKSVEGVDSRQERFAAIFTFFLLFGIIVATITGMIYCKKEKK